MTQVEKSAEARQKQEGYKGFERPELVISIEKASKLIGRSDVVFVDTRNYWKYVKGHIPGAFNLELYAFHWVDSSSEGMKAFAFQMGKLFSSIGIDKTKLVIFYQNNSGYDAARGVWLLRYYGHPNAKLLDGGLRLWRKKKLPLSIKDPESLRGHFEPVPDEHLVATLDYLEGLPSRKSTKVNHQKAKETATVSRNARIVDARTAGEYNGTFKRAIKAGHVPQAINIDWQRSLRRDGTLKDANHLEEIYVGDKGLDKNEEIVTYCQSGYRAAHSWLVLNLLGFRNVRNYIGSWYEWGNDARVPVTRSG